MYALKYNFSLGIHFLLLFISLCTTEEHGFTTEIHATIVIILLVLLLQEQNHTLIAWIQTQSGSSQLSQNFFFCLPLLLLSLLLEAKAGHLQISVVFLAEASCLESSKNEKYSALFSVKSFCSSKTI